MSDFDPVLRSRLIEVGAKAIRDAFFPQMAGQVVGSAWEVYSAAVVDALGIAEFGISADIAAGWRGITFRIRAAEDQG